MVFGGYDVIVRRRQTKIMISANRTNSIVTSLFPENVRSRMYESSMYASTKGAEAAGQPPEINAEGHQSPPIADLYPSAVRMIVPCLLVCMLSDRLRLLLLRQSL